MMTYLSRVFRRVPQTHTIRSRLGGDLTRSIGTDNTATSLSNSPLCGLIELLALCEIPYRQVPGSEMSLTNPIEDGWLG